MDSGKSALTINVKDHVKELCAVMKCNNIMHIKIGDIEILRDTPNSKTLSPNQDLSTNELLGL